MESRMTQKLPNDAFVLLIACKVIFDRVDNCLESSFYPGMACGHKDWLVPVGYLWAVLEMIVFCGVCIPREMERESRGVCPAGAAAKA